MASSGRRATVDALALEVAGGLTIRAAAAALGVSERAVYRASSRPEFRGKVDGLRAEAVAAASGRLSSEMGRAAGVLAGLLASADERTRLAAAVKLIEIGLKVTELTDLHRRVEELERSGGGA